MLRLACVILLHASLAFAEPGDAGDLTREFLAEQQQTLDREVKQGPLLPSRPIEQIFGIDIEDRQLRLRLLPSDINDSATIPLKGVNGVCQIQRAGGDVNMWTATVFAFDRAKARSVSLFLSPAAGRTKLDVVIERPGTSMTSQIIISRNNPFDEDDVGARMYFQTTNEEGMTSAPNAVLIAATPADLFSENHEQMVECVGEGFRLLRAMHALSGMSERQVGHLLISEVAMPPEIERDLNAAMQAVQADPDAGEKQLQSVLDRAGAPAAAALLKMPRETWSADLTMRIDNLLAPYLPDDPGLESELDADPSRLVDLLYWPDAPVRAAVAKRLAALPAAKVDIDPNVDPYTIADKIEALRATVRLHRFDAAD